MPESRPSGQKPAVIVVGAGVSGLSTGLALLGRGHAVTLLDRGTVGSESSWAGGGILSPLLPWDYTEPVAALALHSMAGYADWVAGIEAVSGRDAEFWRCGMLALGVIPEQALDWCAAHGMAVERSCPDTLHRAPVVPKETLNNTTSVSTNADAFSPEAEGRGGKQSSVSAKSKASGSPRPSTAGGLTAKGAPRDDGIVQCIPEENCIWLPGIAQVRNPRLVAALRAAVLKLGGTIHEHCPATGMLSQDRRVSAVQTETGTFQADTVVLASGAWSGMGLAGLAAVPNIRPVRGQMLLFKLAPGVLETIVYCDGLYLIPRRDGHVLAGSTLEDAGFDKSTDAAARQRLHADAAALLPALGAIQPVQHWAGLRPGSPDNIPVIDRHPDFDNVFVNTGHYRYGVTMAPASAELLADLMEGRTPSVDPAPYRWQAALERGWHGA